MTHEKPAMPKVIYVTLDADHKDALSLTAYYSPSDIDGAMVPTGKYVLAPQKAEAVDVEAVKQEIAETFKSMDKVEILIVNLVIDFLAAKGLLKTDKSE